MVLVMKCYFSSIVYEKNRKKISISKKQKRASGKQIKEIIRKVIEYKEKIKNREVKVNNTIKSDNEELSNVIVSN